MMFQGGSAGSEPQNHPVSKTTKRFCRNVVTTRCPGLKNLYRHLGRGGQGQLRRDFLLVVRQKFLVTHLHPEHLGSWPCVAQAVWQNAQNFKGKSILFGSYQSWLPCIGTADIFKYFIISYYHYDSKRKGQSKISVTIDNRHFKITFGQSMKTQGSSLELKIM